jgi:2-iminobutanoate/2-iminopropanoate deaminase
MTGAADMASLSFTTPAGVAAPIGGGYSHLVTVPPGMKILMLAGQTGHAADGSLPADAAAQFRNALTNVVGILKSAGAGPKDIIKINTWLVGKHDLSAVGPYWRELLGDIKPATTLGFLTGLYSPDLLVEIEVMAAVPG